MLGNGKYTLKQCSFILNRYLYSRHHHNCAWRVYHSPISHPDNPLNEMTKIMEAGKPVHLLRLWVCELRDFQSALSYFLDAAMKWRSISSLNREWPSALHMVNGLMCCSLFITYIWPCLATQGQCQLGFTCHFYPLYLVFIASSLSRSIQRVYGLHHVSHFKNSPKVGYIIYSVWCTSRCNNV